jgi:Kdo2-lipid IVA lauroyltransferase/acyltransferase
MLSYYLTVPLLLFISYLPSSVLYRLAEIAAFVLEHIIRYRRQVVWQNLTRSFPEKSNDELQAISSQSYRHLAYRAVEGVKCFTISKAEVHERVSIKNPELIHNFYNKKRHIVLLVGHIASWEYGGYKASLTYPYKTSGVVSLVKNPYFNDLIQKSRGKFGMHLVAMRDSKNFFDKHLDELTLTVFISDQSPSNTKTCYWTNFLNQESAFMTGGERYARLHNCVAIYPKIVQTTRGNYSVELLLIEEHPQQAPPNAITEKYVRILEQHIKEHPADWLWSHKRWKHKHRTLPAAQ